MLKFLHRVVLYKAFSHDVSVLSDLIYAGGWVGRWCWVASSAGASNYFCI